MPRPKSDQPTPQELRILKILWSQGPQPVRDIRDALAADNPKAPPALTSVSTILNIMVRKRYLKRTRDGKAHVYHPLLSERGATADLLKGVVERAFDGSTPSAVLSLLDHNDLDADELKTIRKIINKKLKEQA
jgi:predicted transcriptional regulator